MIPCSKKNKKNYPKKNAFEQETLYKHKRPELTSTGFDICSAETIATGLCCGSNLIFGLNFFKPVWIFQTS